MDWGLSEKHCRSMVTFLLAIGFVCFGPYGFEVTVTEYVILISAWIVVGVFILWTVVINLESTTSYRISGIHGLVKRGLWKKLWGSNGEVGNNESQAMPRRRWTISRRRAGTDNALVHGLTAWVVIFAIPCICNFIVRNESTGDGMAVGGDVTLAGFKLRYIHQISNDPQFFRYTTLLLPGLTRTCFTLTKKSFIRYVKRVYCFFDHHFHICCSNQRRTRPTKLAVLRLGIES